MPDTYLTSKIQEALKVTNGDKKDAVKLLTTWAVRDQALLLGFTKAHLKDIISDKLDGLPKSAKKMSGGNDGSFKEAIVLGGDKRAAVAVPPPKSSERQASVMHQLAAAFKKK
ncbi:MAG: hypothetical protein PHD48_06385 [Alphaproteobacteria bacterium]|nr:hypothetical protein [Alphaproteobacteria bacterium]